MRNWNEHNNNNNNSASKSMQAHNSYDVGVAADGIALCLDANHWQILMVWELLLMKFLCLDANQMATIYF